MRLRPSGQSGPLVTHLDAFRQYQLTKAWVWEHQALVRARPVAGETALTARFADVRREVLCQRRDPVRLATEVQEMRARMRATQPAHTEGLFDLKHDAGGIVDIEFMVQYAALRWAADYPAVVADTDNIHILRALARAGRLDEARAAMLADAYRRYLSLEQRLKLMDNRPLVERAELGDDPDAIARIWHAFFEEN
jgi:glutamate-ammonia-ligase adenylyltransferase